LTVDKMAFAPEIAGGGMGMDLGGYAADELPPEMRQMQERKGVAFQTDLANVGGSGTKGPFGQQAKNVEAQERKDIEKVFNLVDRDGSGHIDITELTGMFSIFGIESQFISTAIARVMSNVDKDRDNMITPSEFYAILSQRFEKGDDVKDMENVFHKMDKNRDGKLDVDELMEVSTLLGENRKKSEIQDMIAVFSQSYQTKKKEYERTRGANKTLVEPKPPNYLDISDFVKAMQMDIVTPSSGVQDLLDRHSQDAQQQR